MQQNHNYKYTLFIDQRECLRLGIDNINQAIIFDLLGHADKWAKPIMHDGKVYYWVARQAIAAQLPILDLKPDTIYRHLKVLSDSGVIHHIKIGRKDCIRMTKSGKSYYLGNKSELEENSEMNPSKLGNESESNSDLNPTDKTTKYNKTTTDDMFGSNEPPPPQPSSKNKKVQVPYQKIVDLYHKMLPEMREIEKLTPKRKQYLKSLFISDLPTQTHWENYFNFIRDSDFLMGRLPPMPPRTKPFSCNLEWITHPDKFVEISEEKYHG